MDIQADRSVHPKLNAMLARAAGCPRPPSAGDFFFRGGGGGGGGPASAPLTKKVLAACKKLSYVPDIGARAFVTGRPNDRGNRRPNFYDRYIHSFLERLDVTISK